MIVVEGPDGAGKTTLINTLREATGLEVAPRVVSKDTEAMVDLVKWTEENVRKGWQNLIFDRHRLISEPIYGPQLRATPAKGFDSLEWFYEQMSRFYEAEPITIYCLPPFEQVWANILADDDNSFFHGNRQGMQAIYGAYVNKYTTEALFKSDTFLYDYTDTQARKMITNYIISRINRRINDV